MIEVKNLVKCYQDHVAVDNLNFTIENGKIYGLLGPNGAGKSTTMNMMTGYLASTQGSIKIDGHDILQEPEEAKKCIGYLPEIPPLYPEMTVSEYLKFDADLKGIAKKGRDKHLDEVMNLVKIKDVQNRLIKNLSKGYRQRVGLAQAVLGYPETIILDEPTVGLDPKQIIEIRDLIKNLGKKHTVVLSSHILSEVSAVCDVIMIISHGKLVASDTPDNLSKHLIGSNTLELTVKGSLDEVTRGLSNLTDSDNMKSKESSEKDSVDITITTPKDIDLREKVFNTMADIHCPILKMQLTTMSLEDVFLELTKNEEEGESHESDL